MNWKPKRTAKEARAIVALRRAEAKRIGCDPGREWAEREYEKHRQQARARVTSRIRPADRPQLKPANPPQPRQLREDLLAVCRVGCPDYIKGNGMGGSESCRLDYAECAGCKGKAKARFVQRVYGDYPPCKRQRNALGLNMPVTEDTTVGMVSPARQGRIQIEITNACPHSCSNCTRFTRLVQKPFFMDLPTFQRAVDSMAGYGGMLGIMGGEPTIHPKFPQLIEYYREHWHPGRTLSAGRDPIEDFSAYHAEKLQPAVHTAKRGLWTSLGPGYSRHYELIQETFPYQCVNTHANASRHQAFLVGRKELGIDDDTWVNLRDRCWVQRLWSSSITPNGCFPCEIMAALDMLYDGPGGWPIEPGWWRRTPDQFGDLLQWCEICGMALDTPERLATDEIQDVSPYHAERITLFGSPAVDAGRLKVLDVGALAKTAARGHRHKGADWYMPIGDKSRRAENERSLTRKRIEAITVSVDCGDELRRTLPSRVSQVDRFIVVTASHDKLTQKVAAESGAIVVVTDACYNDEAAFNKGAMLNAGLGALQFFDWVVFTDADIFFPPNWREQIDRLVLNPGCLYYTRRWHLPENVEEPDFALIEDYHLLDPHGNNAPWGYFQMWNTRARSLPSGGLRFPLCFCSAGTIDHWFKIQWPKDKQITLPQKDRRFDVLHLWHGGLAERWNGQRDTAGRWRYAGQTDLGRIDLWRHSWPAPCRVRRTEVATCSVEEADYLGTAITWSTPMLPGMLYEFSIKEPRA